MDKIYRCRLSSFILLLSCLSFFISCTSNNSTTPVDESPVPNQIESTKESQWIYRAPFGGFISAIRFHPANECEVWASGDDMSGLYKSTNCGTSWEQVKTPKNFSAYSIEFDPNDFSTIYAPSHFGLGLLKTTDSGNSWELRQAGLPDTVNNRRAYQLAINPKNSKILVIATSAGLYRSIDSGKSFLKLDISWEQSFQAAVYSSSGRLFSGGSKTGIFKYSDDNGDTWTDLYTGYPVVEMHVSKSALYVLYYDGTLQFFNLSNFNSGGTLNTGTSGITTGVLATLKVVSGASQKEDKLFLGTTKRSEVPVSRWGLFSSQNGGQTWRQHLIGLESVSIFRIDVNPKRSEQILIGSASGAGLFRSDNSGEVFFKSDIGIKAISAAAFAQNAKNRSELVLSNSVGLGMSRTFHSLDEGKTWTLVPEIDPADGILSFNFDPIEDRTLLAGMFSKGIYRSTNGIVGPWDRVINANIKISRIIRDKKNPALIYALATGGDPSSDVRVYVSNDSGKTFVKRPYAFGSDIAVLENESEALLTSPNDVFASTNSFQSLVSIGLESFSKDEGGMTAVAVDPKKSSFVIVGGASGGLYATENFSHNYNQIKWTKLKSPVQKAIVQKIIVQNQGNGQTIYVASHGGDVFWNTSGTLGLFKSTDSGNSWVELSSSLAPCTSFWDLFLDEAGAKLWAPLWGGGLFQYSPL